MQTHTEKKQTGANLSKQQEPSSGGVAAQFVDMRPEALVQRRLQKSVINGQQGRQLSAFGGNESKSFTQSKYTMSPQPGQRVAQLTADPTQDQEYKNGDLLALLATLNRECSDALANMEKMRLILEHAMGAIVVPGDIPDDIAVKDAALCDHIAALKVRLSTIEQATAKFSRENKSKRVVWSDALAPIPQIIFGTNVFHDNLEQLNAYFDEELVTRRKQGRKLPRDAPADPEQLDGFSTEEVLAVLRQNAAPLHVISYDSIRPLTVHAVQGFHANREGNLPAPEHRHYTESLIELSASCMDISGARLVMDVEKAGVFFTAHYGQNIVQRLLVLAAIEEKSSADRQEIQALLLLKKLVNDFVLIDALPGVLRMEIEDLAYEAYLDNHIQAEKFHLPPEETTFRLWCISHSGIVRAKLRAARINARPHVWHKWMRSFTGLEI